MKQKVVHGIAIDKTNHVKQGSIGVDIILYFIALLLALITVFPVYYIIINSFSDPQEVMKGTVLLAPQGFYVDAYKRVFSSSAMIRAFFNSIVFTASATFLNLLVTMMAAYGLSRKTLPGRKGITFYFIIPMWFGAGMIPTFITVTKLGLYNTIWAVLLPAALSVYNIVLARTFVKGIPMALQEAAQIDGASPAYIFFSVILPLSKPIMAVLGLYTALAAWNNWFSFVLYLPSHDELHPLQYFLVKALLWGNTQSVMQVQKQDFKAAAERVRSMAVGNQLKYAVVVVATVPIMCVYPFVQKYFVKGVMLGSLKE